MGSMPTIAAETMPERGNESGSEAALLKAARNGDESAFRILFDRHAAELQGRARRAIPASLRRRLSESDVVQDAFLVAFRRLGEFRETDADSFRAWLARILEWKLREARRRHLGTARRSVARDVTRGGRPASGEFPASGPSPSQVAAGHELEARVESAISRLAEDHGTVVRLVHSRGYSFEAAAELMERSAEAVRKLYSRALAELAKDLGLSGGDR